jgi:hypothetical protein
MSRWRLSDNITTIAGVHVRGRSTYIAAREAGIGPLQMPRPATAASGYRGGAGTTLTFDSDSRFFNQKDAYRLCALASGVEASSAVAVAKLGGRN